MTRQKLIAGDSATWLLPCPAAFDPETVTATLNLCGPVQIALTPSSIDGRMMRFNLTPAQSATLTDGSYALLLICSSATERATVRHGMIKVVPDPTTVTDHRTQAQRALDECDAAIAQFNSSGGRVQSYTIAGRSMTFSSLADLMQLRSFWQRRLYNEMASGELGDPRGDPSKLLVRFR